MHGDLNEEIYVEQPKVFEVYGNMILVCKVTKSLYGLNKQSPQKWYKSIDDFMRPQSYARRNEDSCLYTKKYR